MSNTMEHALANRTQHGPQRTTPRQENQTAPPPRKTGADIIAKMKADADRAKAEVLAAAKNDKTAEEYALRVEDVYARLDADLELTRQIKELTSRRYDGGSSLEEDRLNDLQEKQSFQITILAELQDLKTKHSLAYQEGSRLYAYRLDAFETADANRAMFGSAKAATIQSRIEAAVEKGFVVVTTEANYKAVLAKTVEAEENTPKEERKGPAAFSFSKLFYVSSQLGDPSMDNVAVSLRELIDDLQRRNDDQKEKTVFQLRRGESGRRGGFYISTYRQPTGNGQTEDSELDQLKKRPGRVSLRALLKGKGERTLVTTFKNDVALIERQEDGTIAVTATSDWRFGDHFFFQPKDGQKVLRGGPVVLDIKGNDLSRVKPDNFRQTMERQLQAETEALTFADLQDGEKGPCSISARWRSDARDPNSPEVTLRGQLIGKGDGTFYATDFNPKIVAQIDPNGTWLAKAMKEPQPIEILGSGKWPALAAQNRHHEHDLQFARMVEDLDAVPVSETNLDGLTSIDQGQNGCYVVRALVRISNGIVDSKKTYKKNPVEYVIKREGSTVEIVGAVPGFSVSYAEKLRGQKCEIATPPWDMKVILGSLCYGIRQETPEHLKLTKKQEEEAPAETQRDTTEVTETEQQTEATE